MAFDPLCDTCRVRSMFWFCGRGHHVRHGSRIDSVDDGARHGRFVNHQPTGPVDDDFPNDFDDCKSVRAAGLVGNETASTPS